MERERVSPVPFSLDEEKGNREAKRAWTVTGGLDFLSSDFRSGKNAWGIC